MSPELIDHFSNPRNVGELPAPGVTVEAANPICGDILRLSARIEGEAVAEVRYKVRGCAASIATGSALTELMLGQSLESLALVKKEDVENAVGGLSNESKHAASLCLDGLKLLLGQLKHRR